MSVDQTPPSSEPFAARAAVLEVLERHGIDTATALASLDAPPAVRRSARRAAAIRSAAAATLRRWRSAASAPRQVAQEGRAAIAQRLSARVVGVAWGAGASTLMLLAHEIAENL